MLTLTKTLLALFILAFLALMFGMLDVAVSFGTIDSATRDTGAVIRDFARNHTTVAYVLLGFLLLTTAAPRMFGSKQVS